MQVQPLRFPLWAKITTVAIVTVLFVLLLRAMGGLLLPFLWAVVTAYLLSPLVRFLTNRTKIRRFWWVLMLYLIAGLLIFAAVNTLIPRLSNQLVELQSALPNYTQSTISWLERYGTLQFGTFKVDLKPAEADITKWATDLAGSLPGTVPQLVKNVIEGLILAVVFLVVTFYLLLQGERIVESFYNLIPAAHRDEIRELGRSIDRVLGAYIRSQIILIVFMSVLTWAALSLLGVQYALVLGIATGFLEVIPLVGPYTAAGIAVFVSLVQSATPFGWPNWVLALVVAGTYLVLRQAEDHLIIPNLVGHILALHPIIVIFAILAGGHLAGALGLFIAIPITAAIRLILVYLYNKLIDNDHPISDVHDQEDKLAGKPADTAIEAPRRPAAKRRRNVNDEPATR